MNWLEPDELFLTRRERDALLRTLEALESGKIRHVDVLERYMERSLTSTTRPDPDSRLMFNMTCWAMTSPGCGTIVCLGGATQALTSVNLCDVSEAIAQETGSESWGLHDLLFGTHHGEPGLTPLNSFLVEDAIRGLRNYLTTGWPDWPAVLGERWK